jgi:endonuclease YncB( thermonuclease family)
MAVGEVVRVAWPRPRRRRARPLEPLWLPPLALIAVAMSGWLALASGVAGAGNFRLCRKGEQPNCVVDGDTIRHAGVRIRLADIDAPETFSPQCASEHALGRRATIRLIELMNAGPFTLMAVGGPDEDLYGRKLRIVARGGRSVADALVAEGLARPWDGARRGWCG